jgi:hypothetical protein
VHAARAEEVDDSIFQLEVSAFDLTASHSVSPRDSWLCASDLSAWYIL